jgi:hypothetical protein
MLPSLKIKNKKFSIERGYFENFIWDLTKSPYRGEIKKKKKLKLKV